MRTFGGIIRKNWNGIRIQVSFSFNLYKIDVLKDEKETFDVRIKKLFRNH